MHMKELELQNEETNFVTSKKPNKKRKQQRGGNMYSTFEEFKEAQLRKLKMSADLSVYLNAKPSEERAKLIHAEQEKIKPTEMAKDPKKYFLYKNKKELVDHFHKLHGIKERIPIEMQGLTLADLDPL